MSSAEKLLQRMRQTKNGWTCDDFEDLYTGYGFEKEEGGNHTTYVFEQYKLIEQVPRHKKLAPYYARAAIRIIDQLLAFQAEDASKEREKESNDKQG